MANYLTRTNLKDELHPLEERNNLLQAHKRTPESIKVSKKDGSPMTEVEVEEEVIKSTARIEQLNAQLTELATNKAGQLIHAADLNECLIVLGNLPSMQPIHFHRDVTRRGSEEVNTTQSIPSLNCHALQHKHKLKYAGNYSQQNFLFSRLTVPLLPYYREKTYQERN